MERMFAKPFVAALDDHHDAVSCMAKHPALVSKVVSGAYDGEVKVWSLDQMTCVSTIQAHTNIVSGTCFVPSRASLSANKFLTCSVDMTVKLWNLRNEGDEYTSGGGSKAGASEVFMATEGQRCVDHHYGRDMFVSGGSVVHLWDHMSATPVSTYGKEYTAGSVLSVRFNHSEQNTFACATGDGAITLYDTRASLSDRAGKSAGRVTLKMNTNSVRWNPYEPQCFIAANEDGNLYTFDLRKLDTARNVHKDHVLAVMDVDFAPTGREFVSASYDETIRVWKANQGRSRDVYHTRRMGKVFSTLYSMDSKYLMSGSADANLRVWKAHASERMGLPGRRERDAIKYRTKLTEKYGEMEEVKKILGNRHVPGMVKAIRRTQADVASSRKRKEMNTRRNRKKKTAFSGERKKHIRSSE